MATGTRKSVKILAESAQRIADISISQPQKRAKIESAEDELMASAVSSHKLDREFQVNRNLHALNILSHCENNGATILDTRVRTLLDSTANDNTEGVLYWMWRDRRVQDNWALLYSQKLALENKCPLHVLFCLPKQLGELNGRHYRFILEGLSETAEELKKLDIPLHVRFGDPADLVTEEYLATMKLTTVVCDFSPLRYHRDWTSQISSNVRDAGVKIFQVDSHNIVPVWVASQKRETQAFRFRPRLEEHLKIYLGEFPPVVKHPYESKSNIEDTYDIEAAYKFVGMGNRPGDKLAKFEPGRKGAWDTMEIFLKNKFKNYANGRNDPNSDVQSNLSPWLNNGQISAQRCVLYVKKMSKSSENWKSFLNEAVVWREMSDNFCYYNEQYDSVDGAAEWAKETLRTHNSDKRSKILTLSELEKSKSSDDIWNAAQTQLVKEGKMHGFLRMYWAKKILEWTPSAEEALRIAIILNDRYAIDGNDPNGYHGIAWSITGANDRGFAERAIFGKVRFMSYAGCARKFDVKKFTARYKNANQASITSFFTKQTK